MATFWLRSVLFDHATLNLPVRSTRASRLPMSSKGSFDITLEKASFDLVHLILNDVVLKGDTAVHQERWVLAANKHLGWTKPEADLVFHQFTILYETEQKWMPFSEPERSSQVYLLKFAVFLSLQLYSDYKVHVLCDGGHECIDVEGRYMILYI